MKSQLYIPMFIKNAPPTSSVHPSELLCKRYRCKKKNVVSTVTFSFEEHRHEQDHVSKKVMKLIRK